MAGHSKWAQIKRQKAVTDAKRGQAFTKIGRELTIAAQHSGPDPIANVRLEQALARAKAANMPKDTIERAIQRGSGGGTDGEQLEEITYEGYAHGGTGILIEVVTDNRNRSVAEVRNALTRLGGTFAEAGAVAWQFSQRGAIAVSLGNHAVADVELAAIDLGVIDVEHTEDLVHVYTEATDLDRVKTQFEKIGHKVVSAELTMIPRTPATLDEKDSARVLGIVEALEELDDVRRVHVNVELSENLLVQLAT